MENKRLLALENLIGQVGKVFYLDPANGNDGNSGLGPKVAFKTLPVAYSKLTANKNETLVLIGNNASISLTAQLDWAKDYTHFIGFCSPVDFGKRARIFQTATATAVDLLKVSASGCIWKNIYAFHGVNDATSKICLTVTGSRNYFEGCHFAGIGNVTMSVTGAASVKIDGGSENTFKDCVIGLDTIARDADATELWLDGAASRNVFKGCKFTSYISAAGFAHVTLEDGQAIDRSLIFEDCLFSTDSENKAVTQTSVFNIKAAIVQGWIGLFGKTAMRTDGASASGEWDSNNRGIIWSAIVAPSASASGGVMTKQ